MSEEQATNTQIRGAESLEQLRLGTGFSMDERPQIIHQFQALGARLKSFKPEKIDMELSVKEREGVDQKVTLELWVAGHQKLTATSARADMQGALQEVRDDMVRQIGAITTKH